MKDVDCSALAYIQNSVPLLSVLLAQFVDSRAYGANRLSVRWTLPKLQLVKSVSEVLPDASRKPAQRPSRVGWDSDRNKQFVIVWQVIGFLVTCIHVARMLCHDDLG